MSMDDREKRLDELEQKLGISFLNRRLLDQSLTHSSYANEQGMADNERMEFLGDAVIKLVISEYLFNKFPARPEGDLTKIRAAVISDDTLAKVANKIKIGNYILLSKNEKASGGSKRKSNMANAFEALVGAIFLDAGLGKSRDFLVQHLTPDMDRVSQVGYIVDFKSALQEFAQKRKWQLPYYKVIKESGPKHKKIFIVGVRVDGKIWGKGSGANKKEAEQGAAQQALRDLQKREKPASGIKGVVRRFKNTRWIF